ncbi:MAG TPA: sigma-70 family RNA polymerase sigma factor [Gammaproteobacteria bacterium]|nr:sigma-70 family RNA polymerase sigma factor [Gammaproteobacteria bacterium]
MTPQKNTTAVHQSAPDARQWVPEHGDMLYRFALMRVRDASVAEDLVQETFLAALKGRQDFHGGSSERTWLVGILKHKIVDHFRQAVREVPTDDIDAEVDAYFNDRGEWAVPPSVLDNPTKNMEQEDLRGRLAECLEGLPERQSRAFVLTQVDGLAAGETCKLLGITSTNLWVMLHRARLRLRHCLEHKGFGSKG